MAALGERGGRAGALNIERATKAAVTGTVEANVAEEARLNTDESKPYNYAKNHVASHETVHHTADEYVRGVVHTKSVEGYFSVFKRGMRGMYQHRGEKHLHRYLAEFDFRFNNRVKLGVDDGQRTSNVLRGIVGKRLTYRGTDRALAQKKRVRSMAYKLLISLVKGGMIPREVSCRSPLGRSA